MTSMQRSNCSSEIMAVRSSSGPGSTIAGMCSRSFSRVGGSSSASSSSPRLSAAEVFS